MAKANWPFGKLATILLIAWLLLGLLPVFSLMFGPSFLPSSKWASKTNTLGLIAGFGFAMLAVWLLSKAAGQDSDSHLTKFGTFIGALIFGFMLGKNVVVITGPMAIALIAGDEIELHYTVKRANSIGTKWCRSSVDLDLPMPFNSVCRISSEFRDTLTQGTRVVVSGRGTSLGVYAQDLRRAD
ncbi:hypothetical protein GGQ99_001303 [Aminobacter niigataensis]|uniref:Uncharacterized protein n=1 Tax=Aminobacter niigataensis TaxID=83265 RepID=A0ABR6KYU0_9HYPH|nr:hypothetical protein [Aminobacter niigataensis]MBB4649581.1 hypothetical protein [Aminobacter niigataensis]